jgi:hypothetical protein
MKISVGPGPGRVGLENHRAELKLNRAERASRILGPFWAGPGHEKVAHFEPWYLVGFNRNPGCEIR